MELTGHYRSPDDLPALIPVFPLGGALLLPRCQLPLNIFEPRYLKMIDDALRGNRIIGMVQPDGDEAIAASRMSDTKPKLCKIGGAGRLTSFAETEDGRLLITLTGIARFEIRRELDTLTPYRQCEVDWEPYAEDLIPGYGQDEVSRDRLLDILRVYLETHGLQADWRTIKQSSNEQLVNSLSMVSPYGPREKQALLEARSLEDRNQLLIAITEQALAQLSPSDTPMQ